MAEPFCCIHWRGGRGGILCGPCPTVGVWHARKEAAAFRKIIVEDRRLIFEAKDMPDPEDLSVTFTRADEWRAVPYNKMLGEAGRILDHWSPHLPRERKQSLLCALDWYHREASS